jgi:ACS family pantothenate transporter-like MFS transporter
MNEMAYVVQAWLPLLVWQQIDAPQYHKGFITVTCLSVCIIITALGTRFLHQREIRWREKQGVGAEVQEGEGGYDTGVETPPQRVVEQVGGKGYV